MTENELFQAALGLLPPWLVDRCAFNVADGRLDIHLDFPRGSAFPCPLCDQPCKAYDTESLTWRHMDFFQHRAFLHARTPRVECARCGVHRVNVAWARPGSGFTLLFEAFVMHMVVNTPVNAVARMVGEHDTVLWRIVHHYVDSARTAADHSKVTRVGMDETAARRGHDYVSLFVDMDRRCVLLATPGKDAATVAAFAQDLRDHGGDPDAVVEVSSDMSPAFIKGTGSHLPNAAITFDKFHNVKLVNDAVDQVRRQEAKDHPELAGTRYVWLKNADNLTPAQKDKLESFDLSRCHLKTAKAYQIRIAFQDLYNQPAHKAREYLDKWYFWATHSRIQPLSKTTR